MGTILGDRAHPTGGRTPFLLSDDVRERHLYIVGKTGTGKSGLFYNLLLQDIDAGHGCALIDPHGDLAKDILEVIPPSRYREVVIFDPLDDRPVGLNPFMQHGLKDEETLLADEIIGSLKKHLEGFLGASAGSWVPTQRPSAGAGNITPHILERYNFTASHP
jgi:DNA helicase HerA-like ATPase